MHTRTQKPSSARKLRSSNHCTACNLACTTVRIKLLFMKIFEATVLSHNCFVDGRRSTSVGVVHVTYLLLPLTCHALGHAHDHVHDLSQVTSSVLASNGHNSRTEAEGIHTSTLPYYVTLAPFIIIPTRNSHSNIFNDYEERMDG